MIRSGLDLDQAHLFWYIPIMPNERILQVVFYRTTHGVEPVRDWLRAQSQEDKKRLGEDIKTVQFAWPLGMPLVRKLSPTIWEIRSALRGRIARILFTVRQDTIILVHAFIKKSQKTPQEDMELALRREATLAR